MGSGGSTGYSAMTRSHEELLLSFDFYISPSLGEPSLQDLEIITSVWNMIKSNQLEFHRDKDHENAFIHESCFDKFFEAM